MDRGMERDAIIMSRVWGILEFHIESLLLCTDMRIMLN